MQRWVQGLALSPFDARNLFQPSSEGEEEFCWTGDIHQMFQRTGVLLSSNSSVQLSVCLSHVSKDNRQNTGLRDKNNSIRGLGLKNDVAVG